MSPSLRSMVVLALSLFAVGEARAQSPSLQGTFVYVAEGSDDVDQAIRKATSGMNFITRPIARGRLSKTNAPYGSITLSQTPSEVTVVTDGRAPIVTPASGEVIRWTREDGEVLDVNTEWQSGSLVQTFAAEDGKRVNVYTLGPDGNTLSMRVTITSPRLPEPMVYTLRYRRQG